MDVVQVKNSNNKVVIRNLPGTMDENEFRILTQKYAASLSYFKYIKPTHKGEKSKCFLQLSSKDLVSEFIEEFNKAFFDSKGEQFIPLAELSFYQEVAKSVESNQDIYGQPCFLKFKEAFESGNVDLQVTPTEEVEVEKKSQLIISIKQEAEEEKKREANRKPKHKKWKNKGKKWTKK